MTYKIRSTNIIASIILSILMTGCTSNDGRQAEKQVDITLAAEMSLLPATVWIAESKGYFKKHKVNLTIREFDSGRNALETMLADADIDIATVAQTPIVFNSFKKEPYVIFATMAYSLDDIKVLARKDHNILSPKDLKGKNVGATMRSTGHYFLEGFLTHYGYTLDDINLKDVNAAQLKDKLISGELDAITSWEPHIYNAEKAMGEDVLNKFISPTPFRKDFYFTSKKSYAQAHGDRLEQFLHALVDAETYIRNNPVDAKYIVAKKLGVDTSIIDRIWDSFVFELSLEQSILVSLEDEAIWAMKLSDEKLEAPNYLDYIDIRPLSKIKPYGVNIIH